MNNSPISLSVIIITKNGETHLAEVLAAVRDIAAEIILVDSGSTDRTLEIAQEFNAKIYQTTVWPGFGPQKDYALSLATQDWVFGIDDDEVISDELKESIRAAVNSNEIAAYEIDRITYFCGHWLKHGGRRPDYLVRLFPRQLGQYGHQYIHEQVQLLEDIPVKRLKGITWHYSYDKFEEVLDKLNRDSTGRAVVACEDNKKLPCFAGILFKTFWTFLRIYIFKLGFLDGKYGFIFAIWKAEYVYYKYLKLMLMRRKS